MRENAPAQFIRLWVYNKGVSSSTQESSAVSCRIHVVYKLLNDEI